MKKQRNIDELEAESFIPINKFDAKGVYMLSHEEEDGIKEALEQVAKGELISNEDLMLEVASWLKGQQYGQQGRGGN